MINRPLMPKATALWLIKHTCLTWEQIGDFCGLHPLEIDRLDQDPYLQEQDPVFAGQLSLEEIKRCEKDPQARLTLFVSIAAPVRKKYVPLSKRQEVPNAIVWLLRHYPKLSDHRIAKLLPTTKATILAIREGKYWNMRGLIPKDPVLLGLCSDDLFQKMIQDLSIKTSEREEAGSFIANV